MHAGGNTMSVWNDVVLFMYGPEFWYGDPLREIDGLSDEQLFWIPNPKSLCTLWHVGHIANRERFHMGRFIEGIQGEIIPPQFEVFGAEWRSVDDIRDSIESVSSVLNWVRDVRRKSLSDIESLSEDDFQTVPPKSEYGLSAAHWLFITAAHTALHIGRIQALRALSEGKNERAC
jgi:hypothetical protein